MCKPLAHLLNWWSLHHHIKRQEEHNNMLLLPDIVCLVHTLSLRASITDKSKRYSLLSLYGWYARSAFWAFWSYGTSHGCVSCHIRPPIVSTMQSSCIVCLLCPVIGNKGTAHILVFPCGTCRQCLCQSLHMAHFARTNCKHFACVAVLACTTIS